MSLVSEYFPRILEGLLTNLLIVALTFACVFPIGLLLSFFASKSKTAGKVFHWLSLPFECLPIITVLFFVYFSAGRAFHFTALVAALIAFVICFIGYMPARHDPNSSFLKNILYNGLGLISTVFKWSLVSSIIGVPEMIKRAQNVIAITFNSFEVWTFVFICVFILILPIEIARRLIKQLMK